MNMYFSELTQTSHALRFVILTNTVYQNVKVFSFNFLRFSNAVLSLRTLFLIVCHSYFIDGYIFLNSRISDLTGRPRSCIPVTNCSKYARTASVSPGSQRVNFRFLRREVEHALQRFTTRKQQKQCCQLYISLT